MIRRLRWKITGVTMLVAFMVLLAVFGGVYFFSQANIAQSYIHQLKQAVQTGVVDGRFPCFVAEVLPSGTVRVSGSSYYDLDDEEALLDAVSQALADGGESGVLSQRHLRFYRQDGVLTVRIAFMDSTFEQATLRSLVKVCLLIGLGALLVLLGVSWLLSGFVSRPVVRTWQDQQQFISAAAIEKYGWYNRNAAINPYLSEGKKTVALEIAEQLNWEMPDYLAISVGDGCTIAGVWKGFKDLYAIGFIDKLPRLISAQSYGCYPINRAIQENKSWEPMEENTIADSISVGVPRNADKALAAIRESNGLAVCVTDEEILAAQRLLGRTCGVFGEPAGVTGAAALKKACEQGLIEKDATVVSVVTGNGLKDVANAIKSAGEPLHIEPDLDLMVRGFAERGVTVE